MPPPPKARPEDIERLSVPTRGDPRHPRPHAPQVRRPRRRLGLDGLDELDRRVVVARGERHRHRRLARARGRVHARLRGALGQAGRDEERASSSRGRSPSTATEVRPWFCPGFGDALAHRIAKACGRAQRRIRICSPVLTSAPILATLVPDRVGGQDRPRRLRRPDADRGGLLPVADERGHRAGRSRCSRRCSTRAPFSGKRSTPYTPTSVHDYMHAKVTVADDTVFCGSFNLSRSGEQNAENMLEIQDAKLADELAAFVDAVRARYPAATAPHGASSRRAAAGPTRPSRPPPRPPRRARRCRPA